MKIKFQGKHTESGVAICGIDVDERVTGEIVFPKAITIDGKREAVRSICLDLVSNILLGGVVKIVLPEGLQEIGDNCFMELKQLEEVVFPTTLKEIGSHAFSGCRRLKSVLLPEGLTNIGDAAFYGIGSSKRYVHLYVPESAVMEEDAFSRAYISHADVMCTHIAIRAFCGTRFRTLTLSDRLVDIGESAFSYSNALYLIGRLPDTLKYIRRAAFSNANTKIQKYSSLEIPDGVAVGKEAFRYAEGLNRIVTGKRTWRSIMETSSVLSNSGIEHVEIPTGTSSIGDGVCFGCKKLKNVQLPLSVTKINNQAFRGSGLTSLVIPSLVANVYTQALADTSNLEYIEANTYVWKNHLLEDQCISGCGMAHITIPEGVKDLCERALYDCHRLRSVTLPRSLECVHINAFGKCVQLREVKFGPNLTHIRDLAFESCHSLANVELPEGLASIGKYAFIGCRSLTELVLPSTVNEIGAGCFTGCHALRQLVLMMEPDSEAYPWDCPTSVVWYVPDEWVAKAQGMNMDPQRRILPLSAYRPCRPSASVADYVPAGFKRVKVELQPSDFTALSLFLSFAVKPEHRQELEREVCPSMLLTRYLLKNIEEVDVAPVATFWDGNLGQCSIYDPELGKESILLKTWPNGFSQDSPLHTAEPSVMVSIFASYSTECHITLPKGRSLDHTKLKLRRFQLDREVMVDLSGVLYDGVWYPCTLNLQATNMCDSDLQFKDTLSLNCPLYLCDKGEIKILQGGRASVSVNLNIAYLANQPLKMSISKVKPTLPAGFR